MKSNYLSHSLILILTAFIWGTAFVAQSVGMDYIGPLAFNGSRNVLAVIALLPVIFFLDRRKKKADPAAAERTAEEKKQERKQLLIGGICCGIFLFAASCMQQIGIQYTNSVGKAGFITAFYIILVPIFGLFLKKKCTPLIWLSVVLAVIGLYLLCIKDGFSLDQGDVYLFLCAILFSLQIMCVDHFAPKVDCVRMSWLQFLVGAILSWLLVPFLEPETTIQTVISARIPVLYCGILSSGVAYTLQMIGQKGLNPTVASLIMSLESCISVLAGWVLLNQTLSLREGIGCVLMFLAIVLAQLPVRHK